MFEVLINHDKNVSTIFARGIGDDKEDRLLAIEHIDSMSMKVLTDEKENMTIIIEHKFS